MTEPDETTEGGGSAVGRIPHYSDERVTLFAGDCIEVLRDLADNTVDAVVTDPPYG